MFTEEDIQILTHLGLTVSQAKIYLALFKVEQATIKTIAQDTKIARQDIYRIMSTLQTRGLVEKIILAKSTMYKATPIKEGLSTLLQNKKEEYIETEKQVKKMVNNFCENEKQNISPENSQFIITSKLTLVFKMHEKLADKAKKSIAWIAPLKISEKTLFHNQPYLKQAIGRGVKIRIIAEKVKGEENDEKAKSLSENSLFELRYLPETAIDFGMHIFDRQEVTLAISGKPIPSLWTNNAHVTNLAEAYFEKMWNNAQ